MRYVDDTFAIQLKGHKQTFLEHINKMDLSIKFTVEGNQGNSAVPFLDTIDQPEADNTLVLTVYRRPMHTDQYLQWDSHHNLVTNYRVISTLTHRTRAVCTKPELRNNEMQHCRQAQTKCKYPKWAFDKVKIKFINRSQEDNNMGNNQGELSEEKSNNPRQ